MLIERIGAVSGYNSHKEIDFGSKLALPALLADFRFYQNASISLNFGNKKHSYTDVDTGKSINSAIMKSGI